MSAPPAENVLLIYDLTTRRLLRYVIPDFKSQEDGQHNFHDVKLNEVMMKVPLWLYAQWQADTSDPVQNHAQRYVRGYV